VNWKDISARSEFMRVGDRVGDFTLKTYDLLGNCSLPMFVEFDTKTWLPCRVLAKTTGTAGVFRLSCISNADDCRRWSPSQVIAIISDTSRLVCVRGYRDCLYTKPKSSWNIRSLACLNCFFKYCRTSFRILAHEQTHKFCCILNVNDTTERTHTHTHTHQHTRS